ncbi:hypothetical protein GFS31_13590 [Leptolyngbya sp. BL0902]|nr:hypothetical protein GFS31_13590 [Leptolyngbya sp. BL0902]
MISLAPIGGGVKQLAEGKGRACQDDYLPRKGARANPGLLREYGFFLPFDYG